MALGVVILLGCSAPELRGNGLDPPREALDFTLTDQFGEPITLSDFRGKVVVLSFIYTSCPDLCPIITQQLHRSHELLSKDSQRVTFLVITVDPERDTVQRAYDYSQSWSMLDRWHFLVGEEEELVPIWDYYWATPIAAEAGSPGYESALERTHVEQGGDVEDLRQRAGQYIVEHSVPIHLIDSKGWIRVVHVGVFRPEDLVNDIRILLKER